MKIIININNGLTDKKDIKEFLKHFKVQLESGVNSGEYKSEFLNFKWSVKL